MTTTFCAWKRNRNKSVTCKVCRRRRAPWVHLEVIGDTDRRTTLCLGCIVDTVSGDCATKLVNKLFQLANIVTAVGAVLIAIGAVLGEDILLGIGLPLTVGSLLAFAIRARYLYRIQSRATSNDGGAA